MAEDRSRPVPVVVIGAGIGGLAAGIRLAAAGHRVWICEKGSQTGGRARTFQADGFQWDAGPTVLTGPHMFDELFTLAGQRRTDSFDLVEIDPFYRVFDPSGKSFTYWKTDSAFLDEVERVSPGSRSRVSTLLSRVEQIFHAFYPYTERALLQFRAMLWMLPFLIRHRALTSVRRLVRSSVKDPFLQAALEFHPLLIGGNPARTPALYSLISEFERQWGVHYAHGGTTAMVQGLERLFRDLGGQILFDTGIEQIRTDQGRVRGVRLSSGQDLDADVVISNIDPEVTRRLAGGRITLFQRVRRRLLKPSMSLHVFYFGCSRQWPETDLAHHSILLAADHDASLRHIFGRHRHREVSADQRFLYAHLSTKSNPAAAPAGCEAIYVLAAAPALRRGEVPESPETVQAAVLARLESHLPGITESILTSRHIGPTYFRDDLGSPAGEAFSLQPLLLQSAWFRPHNRQRRPRGLYLVGAGTHPGAGIPAVLASARIAHDLINEDLARGLLQRPEPVEGAR